jgi:hypothetical protein
MLTFLGAPTGIGIWDITPVPEGVQILAQIRPRGWLPPQDRTVGVYTPADAPGPSTSTQLAPDGTGYSVASEMRGGHRQIVLRTRRGGTWDEGLDVSQSSGDAFEPSLASLGMHDLALVWSDTRSGAARILYSTRVGGVWTPQEVLTPGAGEFRTPAVGTNARGEVHVAWVALGQTYPQVLYLRFPYLSPGGQPFLLSGRNAVPATPVVSVNATGGAVVIWADNTTWPPVLWFARCPADSAPGPPLTLTVPSGLPQTWVSAVLEPSGTLHSLWIESASNRSDLHYQRRTAAGTFAPQDTTLESSGSTLTGARLVQDPQGALHVTYVHTVSGLAQVLYRRRDPILGWDASATDITRPEDGAASQPGLLAFSPGNVTVVYRGVRDGLPRFMERSRVSDSPPVLAVAPAVPASAGRLAVLPNPVRAGDPLEILWLAPASYGAADPTAPRALDVFDLAGRHVATVPLESRDLVLRGRLGADLTRPWSAGVYFVRARGARGPTQRLVVLR